MAEPVPVKLPIIASNRGVNVKVECHGVWGTAVPPQGWSCRDGRRVYFFSVSRRDRDGGNWLASTVLGAKCEALMVDNRSIRAGYVPAVLARKIQTGIHPAIWRVCFMYALKTA